MKWLVNDLFVMLYKLPWVKSRWAKKFETTKVTSDAFTKLSKPLAECKIALVTTSGVHLHSQHPFNMADTDGDASYRKVPLEVDPAELTITHDYYDHKDAQADINVVVPYASAKRALSEGLIGGVLDHVYSLMGHIQGDHLVTLKENSAPDIARELKAQGVDLAIVTPA